MRFEQTREILANIRDFHESLAHCYHLLEGRAGRGRAKLLLDYLGDREDELAAALDQFLQDADPEVLDTWFQFADERAYLELFCPISCEPGTDVNDVLRLAQEAHDDLLRVYGELVANADMPRVREVFQNLMDKGERDSRTLMRNVNLLADM